MKRIILISVLIVLLSGCAALTDNQLEAISDFGKVTADYDQYPHAVISQYADTRLSLRKYQVRTFFLPDAVLKNSKDSVNSALKLEKIAERAKEATKAISTYSEYLQKLSSSSFSENLEQEARRLGKQVNDSMGKLSELKGTEIPSIGNIVGGGVYLIGNLYIQNRRAKAVRNSVIIMERGLNNKGGDKGPIKTLTDAIKMGMTDIQGNLEELEKELDNYTKSNVKIQQDKEPGLNPAEVIEPSFKIRVEIRRLHQLAEEVRTAALEYASAHTLLYDSVQKRGTDVNINRISKLANTIKKVRQIYKDLKDNE